MNRRLSAPPVLGILAILLLSTATAAANTSHHHSGSGSSASGEADDADCLRWEVVPQDAAPTDARTPEDDSGTQEDAGAPAAGDLVCVEHAALFGCACAMASSEAASAPAALSVVGFIVGVFVRRRKHAR